MAKIIRRMLSLQRFAEGDGGTAPPAETGVTGAVAAPQTQDPQPALRTRRGTPVYAPAEAPEEPAQQTVPATEPTADTYESLVKGPNARFKTEYDRDVQAIVQARLRTAKAQQARTQQLVDVLAKRYGLEPPESQDEEAQRKWWEDLTAATVADQKYLESEAAEQGLTPEQLATIKKLQYQVDLRHHEEQATIEEQRQRALFSRIAREADEIKAEYPTIDIRNEIQNPSFMRLMETGVPVRTAYLALHPELLQQATQAAAQAAQQRVANQIQAGMRRPAENGIGGTASYAEIDVRDPNVRKELRRRAMAGEKVVLP